MDPVAAFVTGDGLNDEVPVSGVDSGDACSDMSWSGAVCRNDDWFATLVHTEIFQLRDRYERPIPRSPKPDEPVSNLRRSLWARREPVVVCRGDWDETFIECVADLGAFMAAGLEAGIFYAPLRCSCRTSRRWPGGACTVSPSTAAAPPATRSRASG